MMCFGLAASNCSAMAMANMGAIAGTASSLQGFVVTTGGAVIGGLIGRSLRRHDRRRSISAFWPRGLSR